MSVFSYYRTITIDHTKVPNTDQTNFRMLFSGTYSWLATVANGGKVQNGSGFDVVFALDSQGNQRLSHQVSLYTAASGLVTMWVRVPSVSHTTDTVVYILYGNSGVTVSQEDVLSAWAGSDGGPAGGETYVAHLDGSSIDLFGINNGTDTAITYNTTNGKIYQGAGFNGTTSKIFIDTATLGGGPCLVSPKGSAGAFNCTGSSAFTFSAWINATNFTPAYSAIESNESATAGHTLLIKSNGKLAVYLSRLAGSINYDGTGVTTLSTGTWYHLAYTYDGATLIGYVNGVLDKSVSDSSGYQSANNQLFGSSFFASRFFTGAIDEIHIANVARSADWLLSEYNNQNSPSTFYTIGSETNVPTAGGGASAFVI